MRKLNDLEHGQPVVPPVHGLPLAVHGQGVSVGGPQEALLGHLVAIR